MEGILDSVLVKQMIKNVFKNKKIEIVKRPASFIIKLIDEPDDTLERLILLPPKGCTSNNFNETSPHPEARKAKVTIKGGVRAGKNGFDILKNSIKFVYYTKREIEVDGDYPYPKVDNKISFLREEIKSSRDTFSVVKENGEGFYHNLINLSNEWILIVLEKELTLQKIPDFKSKIDVLSK